MVEEGKLQFCMRVELWNERVFLGLIQKETDTLIRLKTRNGIYSILMDDIKNITKTNEIFDGGTR